MTEVCLLRGCITTHATAVISDKELAALPPPCRLVQAGNGADRTGIAPPGTSPRGGLTPFEAAVASRAALKTANDAARAPEGGYRPQAQEGARQAELPPLSWGTLPACNCSRAAPRKPRLNRPEAPEFWEGRLNLFRLRLSASPLTYPPTSKWGSARYKRFRCRRRFSEELFCMGF